MIRKIMSFLVAAIFILEQGISNPVFAQMFPQSSFPPVVKQTNFRPPHLRGLTHDFISQEFMLYVDKGDGGAATEQGLKDNSNLCFSYFLTGLALPTGTFWVNLRPDGKEQMLDPELEKTDLGKVLLEADVRLKKDLALLTSPGTPTGREYWKRLYAKAEEIFGSVNTAIPTLSRPWIVPGEIIIGENTRGSYIYKAVLNVKLEHENLKNSPVYSFNDVRLKEINDYSSRLLKEIILPVLILDVNSSKDYACLRQVYYSLILARWVKDHFRNSDEKFYRLIDSKDLSGLCSRQPWSKDLFFRAYKESFEKGEYTVRHPETGMEGMKFRTYTSGGVDLDGQGNLSVYKLSATLNEPFAVGPNIGKTAIEAGTVKMIELSVAAPTLSAIADRVVEDDDALADGGMSEYEIAKIRKTPDSAREKYEHWVSENNRYSAKRFPGFSVIHLLTGNDLESFQIMAQGFVDANPELKNVFAYVDPTSYHLTILDGVCTADKNYGVTRTAVEEAAKKFLEKYSSEMPGSGAIRVKGLDLLHGLNLVYRFEFVNREDQLSYERFRAKLLHAIQDAVPDYHVNKSGYEFAKDDFNAALKSFDDQFLVSLNKVSDDIGKLIEKAKENNANKGKKEKTPLSVARDALNDLLKSKSLCKAGIIDGIKDALPEEIQSILASARADTISETNPLRKVRVYARLNRALLEALYPDDIKKMAGPRLAFDPLHATLAYRVNQFSDDQSIIKFLGLLDKHNEELKRNPVTMTLEFGKTMDFADMDHFFEADSEEGMDEFEKALFEINQAKIDGGVEQERDESSRMLPGGIDFDSLRLQALKSKRGSSGFYAGNLYEDAISAVKRIRLGFVPYDLLTRMASAVKYSDSENGVASTVVYYLAAFLRKEESAAIETAPDMRRLLGQIF